MGDTQPKNGKLTSKPLYSGDGFVLQNTHYDPTILGLSFRRLVVADLVAFSHCTWCQHSRKRNVSLLNEDIGNCVSAVFTELLV